MSRGFWLEFLASAALVCVAGCTRQAEQQAGAGGCADAVRIHPASPSAASELTVVLEPASAHLPGGTVVTWRVNDAVVQQGESAVLVPEHFKKHDRITATVDCPGADGKRSKLEAPQVAVQNASPRALQAAIVQRLSNRGVELVVEAEGTDLDGDDLRFEIAWLRNGEPVGSGTAIDAALAQRGDVVVAQVTASDGEAASDPIATESFSIENQSPRIHSSPQVPAAQDNLFEYAIDASDPDADPLKYEIVEAPEGAVVSEDGRISWPLPAPAARRDRTYRWQLRVHDDWGGAAMQAFTLSFGTGVPVLDKKQ